MLRHKRLQRQRAQSVLSSQKIGVLMAKCTKYLSVRFHINKQAMTQDKRFAQFLAHLAYPLA